MPCNVQCVPVRSHWVRQFILTSRCTLAVWFKNGICVEYPGTSQPWFSQASAAPSPGHYIHQFLYKKMPYRIIRPPCPPSAQTTCCPNAFPLTLHATLADDVGTPCASGTIALTYDAGSQKWTGSGSFGSCGHPISLSFYCPPGNTQCTQLLLDVHWPDGCGLDQAGMIPSTCVCNPLTVQYLLPVPIGCGGNPPNPIATITVTQ